MNQITNESSDWLNDLRQNENEELEPKRIQFKQQFRQETAFAFKPQLATAKGWRRLFLIIKMRLIVRKKLKQAMELELKRQNLPKPSDKSLW